MAYNRKLLYTKSFPSWDTPEGNLGNVSNDIAMTPIQLVATEINEPGSIITYAVTAGALPTGLTLSSSGEISGTPTGYTAAETVNFTITATDNEGETSFRDFSLIVVLNYEVDYLVVAGGGGGGGRIGGGGGGGGLLYSTGYTLTAGTSYVITVGAGGSAGNSAGEAAGTNGGNSIFGTITSYGGGYGGYYDIGSAASGGSGGGEAGYLASGKGDGVVGQGYAGGSFTAQYGAGGGGGAGGVGENGAAGKGGDGGIGLSYNISGNSTYYSGGGGGSAYPQSAIAGVGGLGGGATAGVTASSPATLAAPNSGGGGGGGDTGSGVGAATPTGFTSAGGSGVVILRMPTNFYSGTTTGSPTVTTDGSDTILTYTGSGTYTA